MIENKYIKSISIFFLIILLIISLFSIFKSNSYEISGANSMEYEDKLFGEDIIKINIIMDETQWQTMLDNALNEEYVPCDVEINGTLFQRVGIRPKGNSSLSGVASSDSDRYSFRLKFDEYIKGQNCFGLDTFVLNNNYGDPTYMKEYISYEIMETIGVETPLYGYSDVCLNGENWGLYLAIELYGDSYLERVYGIRNGDFYNVKMENAKDKETDYKRGIEKNENSFKIDETVNNAEDTSFIRSEDNQIVNTDIKDKEIGIEDMQNEEKRNEKPFNQMGNRQGGFGNDTGGSLKYTGDELSNYSSIFNNSVNKVSKTKKQRVVLALEKLSLEEDIEDYFEVDRILRYLAAHTVVVNLDSYSSNMAQNYYIQEINRKITILPWDYNYAFGAFQSNSTKDFINFPIDTPVSGVSMEDRPLINILLSVPEYKEKYHEYLQEIYDIYFSDNKFNEKVDDIDNLISEYVKNDSSSFFTYEEYEKAIDTFKYLGNLRGESIEGQLNGSIPSTTEEQINSDKLIIADDTYSLSDMANGVGMGGASLNRNFERENTKGKIETNNNEVFDGETQEKNYNTVEDLNLEKMKDSDISNERDDKDINRIPPDRDNMGQENNRAYPNDKWGYSDIYKSNIKYYLLLILIILISIQGLKIYRKPY